MITAIAQRTDPTNRQPEPVKNLTFSAPHKVTCRLLEPCASYRLLFIIFFFCKETNLVQAILKRYRYYFHINCPCFYQMRMLQLLCLPAASTTACATAATAVTSGQTESVRHLDTSPRKTRTGWDASRFLVLSSADLALFCKFTLYFEEKKHHAQ